MPFQGFRGSDDLVLIATFSHVLVKGYMKNLVIIALLLSSLPCLSQDTDSLKKIISGDRPAQQRLNAAIEYCDHLSPKDVGEVIAMVKTGVGIARKLHNKKAEGQLNKDAGNAWFLKGNNDSALYCYTVAEGIFQKIEENAGLADVQRHMAILYTQQKAYKKAIEYDNDVLSYGQKQGSGVLTMLTYDQLGKLYENDQNYHDALKSYKAAQDIRDSINMLQKTKDSIAVSYNLDLIGDVFGSMQQKNNSEQSLLNTIETKKSLNDTLAMAINYLNLGILYEGKKQYPKSLSALQQCLQYAQEINYIDLKNSALSELANVFEQAGNYRQALFYFKRHKALNSSLTNENSSKSIAALQNKYEATQKENQILQQRFEITRRNYWVAGIAIILFLSLLLTYSWYRRSQLKQQYIATNAIIETEEKERKRIAQDLHDSVSQLMMAAKINLTVVGNETSFASPEQQKRFERAINLVDDGFREVRTISHNMMPQALLESGLALVIKQFVENIENDSIKINLFSKGFEDHFDGTIETILYRVLQECVNNILKHAKASRVDISLIKDETGISLTIEDNGVGFDTRQQLMHGGMGLKNMQNRINFLKGRLEFDSQPGKGTLVSIYIPVKQRS